MAFNRIHVLALLAFVALSVFVLRAFFVTSDPVAFHDLSLMFRFDQLLRPFDFPWDYKSNLGTPGMINGNMLYNLPLMGLSLVFGSVAFAHKVFMVLMMAFCGFGFYLAFNYFFCSKTAGFVAGLAMMFNPFTLVRWVNGHNTILLALVVLPFAVFCFFKAVKEGGRRFLVACGLLTALLIAIDPHTAYLFMLFMLLYVFVDLVVFRRAGLFARFKFRVMQLVVIFGVGLVGAFPIFYQLAMVDLTVYSVRAEEAFVSSGDFFSYAVPQIVFLIFIAIMIFLLTRNRFLKQVSSGASFIKSQRQHFFFFVLLGGVSLLLFFLATEPFKPVYSWLFNNVPGLSMFREVNKWFLLSSLSGAFFVGFGAELLKLYVTRKKSGFVRKVLPIFLVSIIVFAPSWQFVTGDLDGAVGAVVVPSDYVALEDWLSVQSGNFRVALFPPAVWATTYSWASKWFMDPMVALQVKPTVELKSEFDLTSSAGLSRWVYTSLYSNRTGDWGRLLGVLGVKYLVVRLDADMPASRVDLSAFSLSNTLASFGNQNEFRLVVTFGSFFVYENPYYLPTLYEGAGYSAIVGDRRSLVSLSNLNYDFSGYPTGFLDDNVGLVDSLVEGSHDVLCQGDPYWSLVVSSLGEEYVVRPWLQVPVSSNPYDKWVNGALQWWMWSGGVSVPADGFIYTEATASVDVALNVKNSGQYVVLAQVYDEVLPCGSKGLRFTTAGVGGLDSTFVPSRVDEGSYVWTVIGACDLSSESVLRISNLGGGAAVSKLAVIPVDVVSGAEANLAALFEGSLGNVTYLFDDYAWDYAPDALIVDPIASNGRVVDLALSSVDASFHVFRGGDFSLRASFRGSSADAVVRVHVDDFVEDVRLMGNGSFLQVDVGPFELTAGNHSLILEAVSGEVRLDLAALGSSFDAFDGSSAAYRDVVVPDYVMSSGSEYQIRDASNSLVFLEGGSGYWVLRSQNGQGIASLTVFNYASLFQLNDVQSSYTLTYLGLQYLQQGFIVTVVVLSFFFVVLLLLGSKRFFLRASVK